MHARGQLAAIAVRECQHASPRPAPRDTHMHTARQHGSIASSLQQGELTPRDEGWQLAPKSGAAALRLLLTPAVSVTEAAATVLANARREHGAGADAGLIMHAAGWNRGADGAG